MNKVLVWCGTVVFDGSKASCSGLVAEFGRQLDELRRQARLNYQQLADRSQGEVSRSTLYRAVSGSSLPQWRTVACFVRACGGDEEHWRDQHRAARDAVDTGVIDGLTFSPAPVQTALEFRRLPSLHEVIYSHAVRSFDQALRGMAKAVEDPVVGSIRVRGGQIADYVETLVQLWQLLNHHRSPIRTVEAFAGCLREIKERSGLSFQQISHLTGTQPMGWDSSNPVVDSSMRRPVSVSALSDLCNPRQGRLPRRSTLDRFLSALGYSDAERISMESLRSELVGKYDRRQNRKPERLQTDWKKPPKPLGSPRPVFGGYIESDAGPPRSFQHYDWIPFL